jgi:hypothetical protein
MRIRSFAVAIVLCSVALFACGGGTPEAKSEPNLWADYKGTYATPAGARGTTSSPKPEAKEAKAKAAEPAKDEEEKAAEKAAPSRKASKTTIHGESISAIGPDALAEVSKSALKAKVVNSKLVVGAQYEQVQIQLKGVAVQIVRPAANPVTGGPSVSSPKARNDSLSKTESAWYDEEADVLIVVNAPKKAASQKALGAILER